MKKEILELANEIVATNQSINMQRTSNGKDFYEGYKKGLWKASELLGITPTDLITAISEVEITKAIDEINSEIGGK